MIGVLDAEGREHERGADPETDAREPDDGEDAPQGLTARGTSCDLSRDASTVSEVAIA